MQIAHFPFNVLRLQIAHFPFNVLRLHIAHFPFNVLRLLSYETFSSPNLTDWNGIVMEVQRFTVLAGTLS